MIRDTKAGAGTAAGHQTWLNMIRDGSLVCNEAHQVLLCTDKWRVCYKTCTCLWLRVYMISQASFAAEYVQTAYIQQAVFVHTAGLTLLYGQLYSSRDSSRVLLAVDWCTVDIITPYITPPPCGLALSFNTRSTGIRNESGGATQPTSQQHNTPPPKTQKYFWLQTAVLLLYSYRQQYDIGKSSRWDACMLTWYDILCHGLLSAGSTTDCCTRIYICIYVWYIHQFDIRLEKALGEIDAYSVCIIIWYDILRHPSSMPFFFFCTSNGRSSWPLFFFFFFFLPLIDWCRYLIYSRG